MHLASGIRPHSARTAFFTCDTPNFSLSCASVYVRFSPLSKCTAHLVLTGNPTVPAPRFLCCTGNPVPESSLAAAGMPVLIKSPLEHDVPISDYNHMQAQAHVHVAMAAARTKLLGELRPGIDVVFTVVIVHVPLHAFTGRHVNHGACEGLERFIWV